MLKVCEEPSCRREWQAKRSHARYCSDSCRRKSNKRKRAGGTPPAAVVAVSLPSEPAGGGDLESTTLAELEAAGRASTPLGSAVLALARRIDASVVDTGSSYAALVREWRSTMAEVMAGAKVKADALDELAARRRQRASG